MNLRWLFQLLSPAGVRSRLSVLIFHRVHPQTDPIFPGEMDAARFEAMLGWIGKWFNVLPLPQAVAGLREGSLPARALAITFDDGYADNATVAAPILQRLGMPATFFVAAGYLGGGRMWNDTVIETVRRAPGRVLDLRPLDLGEWPIGTAEERRHTIESLLGVLKYRYPEDRDRAAAAVAESAGVALPADLMMTPEQVRGLARAGMTVGGHTVNHPILAAIPDEEARAEIVDGKTHLERITGAPVTLFAYPNGKPLRDYDGRHVAMVRQAGFDAAFSTAWGAARREADPFQLPRFTPWDRTRLRYGLRMAWNLRQHDHRTA